jgi:hypothetical protein
MQVSFRFFDEEKWSVHATIISFIILVIFAIAGFVFEFPMLIIASLISMMTGDLLPKLIFSSFLGLLFYEKSFTYIKKMLVILLATTITNFVREGNAVHSFLMEQAIMLQMIRILIIVWFLYIFYRMVV